GQVAGRMAAGRRRDRPGAGRVPICARPEDAQAGAPARRALSVAQQSDRGRSRRPVGLLPPAGPGGGGVSNAQGRPRRPPDPPSGTGANRGAHLHRLPRLLSARHPRAAPERARAGPDPAQRVREIRRRADDRRPHPHRRRPRTAADPLHPAGARADAPPPPPQARPARPAAPQNHLSPSRRRAPPVVPTFRGNYMVDKAQSDMLYVGRQAGASLEELPFKLRQDVLDGIRNLHEYNRNRLTFVSLNLAESYVKGNINISVKIRG